jgi:hypothetical protein
MPMCEPRATVSRAVARKGAETSRNFTQPRAVRSRYSFSSRRTAAAVLLESPIGRSWDFTTEPSCEGNSR